MKNKLEKNFNKFNKKLLNTKLFQIPTLNKLYRIFINREVILYLVFGILTTLINLVSFYLLSEYLLYKLDNNLNITISNTIAFIIAVIFAFITNKLIVFESNEKNIKKSITEFIKFLSARILTFIISTAGILVFVNILLIHKYISKILFNVIEIILNYILSKLFIFNTKNKKG